MITLTRRSFYILISVVALAAAGLTLLAGSLLLGVNLPHPFLKEGDVLGEDGQVLRAGSAEKFAYLSVQRSST